MKKLKYSLFVSDFDGTLVNEDGTISEIKRRFVNT